MLTTKPAGKDSFGGAKLHAVYRDEELVCFVKEVFPDVFYVGDLFQMNHKLPATRHRSLKAALAQIEEALNGN